MSDRFAHPDVLIVGGGVIGMAVAWRCLQRGAQVTVLDPAPGAGASRTAAGMLAPTGELHFGEQALLDLTVESAARYPAFVAELQSCTGTSVGYLRCGTVVAAWDGADLAALRDVHRFAASLGLAAQLLDGRELRRLEPSLAAALPGGLLLADDHQVDNRLVHAALLAAVTATGGTVLRQRVVSVGTHAQRVTAVTVEDGTAWRPATTVLAAGAWSTELVPDAGLPAIRPVKGQTLRLRTDDPAALSHVVRGSVKGSSVYVVPRADGELVVGASSDEAGFDLRPRAGAVYEMLRDAQSLLPLLGEAELLEVSTALRPGSPDNAPVLGRTAVDGLIVATGHYRNGVLLAPVTADAIAELIATSRTPAAIAAFGPDRFAATPAVPAWTVPAWT